jgi:hypothetical protein
MSENKEEVEGKVKFSQVLAGALAAVTAALIGSTMGVGGTVAGAGLASVISTVGGTLYLRSIQRTSESVRTVRAKVIGKSGGSTVLVADEDPEEPAPGEEVEAVEVTEAAEAVDPAAEDRPPARKRRSPWPVLVATTVAAFALGMLAVTGVEWLRGESLSGGSGTTFGSIVAPRQESGDRSDPSGPVPPTTSTTTGTPTDAPAESTTSTPPTTTSTRSPSGSGTTTTTTAPPATTTTEATPEGGTVPPSG